MRAIISDNQWIYFDNITVAEEEILWVEFSVTRPGMYIDPSQRGNWDGIYRKYNRGQQRIARPLLSMLRGICAKHNLPLVVKDDRPAWQYQVLKPEEINNDFLPGITLAEYQVNCIRKAVKVECGIVDIPTGGGKGELICGFCKAIQCPTLILADQKIVIDQLKVRLELRDVAEEVGLFYAGKRPNGELIVVGSIQSLTAPSKAPDVPSQKLNEPDEEFLKRVEKWDRMFSGYRTRRANAKKLQQYVKTAEMLIVDECVHEDSWITTNIGLLRAADLYDRLSMTQSNNHIKARVGTLYYPITNWSDKTDAAVTVVTNTGRELTTSKNHQFILLDKTSAYCVGQYAEYLEPDDLLLVSRCNINVSCDERWRHLGLFIGDGHFLSDTSVRFAVRKDINDWQVAALEMAKLWGGELKFGYNKRNDFVFVLKSIRFCTWLLTLGFKPGRKMGSIDPKFIIPNHEAAVGLLRGLFDAEGSSYPSSITFDSIDAPLVRFVQLLCSYLGIGSSVFISNHRTSNKHATLWRTAISGQNARKWQQQIGFGFSRKITTAAISSVDSDRHINPQPWLTFWRSSGLPSLRLAKILGICSSQVSPAHKEKISLSRLVEWQHRIDAIANFNPGDYESAKIVFGISDQKIAKANMIDTKTAWNRRKRGDDSLWRNLVQSIQQSLQSKRVSTEQLEGYAVESVVEIRQAGLARLIDFTVPGPNKFEANGLLVHNCDKAVSDPWKSLFRHYFRGRRRFGFSGTPFDPAKPVEGLVMQEHLGSVIFTESREHLTNIGRIIPCAYYSLAYGVDGSVNEASAYDIAYNEHMTESDTFHQMIARLCRKCKKEDGDGTLVLVDREALGWKLEAAIKAMGLTANFIFGKTPQRKRDEVLRSFECRKLDVLIGGKIINRGLDLKGGCENLIIATGGKLQSGFIQQVGRALRHNRKGKSRIYDFFFRCNRYLYDHSKARLKAMICAGYRTTVVFPGGGIDGAELVRNRFQIKRKLLTSQSRATASTTAANGAERTTNSASTNVSAGTTT